MRGGLRRGVLFFEGEATRMAPSTCAAIGTGIGWPPLSFSFLPFSAEENARRFQITK